MSTPIVRRPGMSSLYVWCSAYVRRRRGVDTAELMPPNTEERPYKVYRAGPRGLKSFLRGEDDTELPGPGEPGRRRRDPGRKRRLFRGPWTVGRVIKYILVAILGWLLLSLVLFIISAQIETGNLPSSAS